MAVEVKDVPEAKRYEARIEGESEIAGVADYLRRRNSSRSSTPRSCPGTRARGSGRPWPGTALDEARAAKLRVLPTCPFFAGWIARHPEYQDLLYQSRSSVSD
ncbi:N-acetyltransferase OS=Streptomyces microflavus OX=1919 GN=Smic_46240 PE=4 SV=1 [Streptomyces microflavus]